jgi:alpha-tubulin suppressor-like RCC1 family protein
MDNFIIDILIQIALALPDHDLLNYCLTCKKFSTIITNEHFWKLKVTIPYPSQQKVITWKNTYFVVTQKLYVFGHTILSSSEKHMKNTFTPIDLFGDIPINSVKCGKNFTQVVSNNKKLIVGKNKDNKEEIHRIYITNLFGDTKTEFSYGKFRLAVIADHQLYTVKFTTYYDDVVYKELKHVEFFADKKVTLVSCGKYHIAVVANCKLYTYGCGLCGKLGHNSNENIAEPTQVKAFENMKVTMVSCGNCHTAVVADKKLYTFGSAWYGKLGHGNQEHIYYPKHVEYLHDVIAVSCGSDHTAVIARKI